MRAFTKTASMLLCSGLLSLAISGSAQPPVRGERGEGEQAWRMEREEGESRGRWQDERRGFDGRPGHPGHRPGPHPRHGMSGPLMEVRGEIHRIEHEKVMIEKQTEELAEAKKEGKISEEAINRRETILEMRRELLKLQQEDFTSRTKERIDAALEQMEQRLAGSEPDGPQGERLEKMAVRMQERLNTLKESGNDYDSLVAQLRELEGAEGETAMRTERLQREIDMLSERLEALRGELQHLGIQPPQPGAAPPPAPPPPGPPRPPRPDGKHMGERPDREYMRDRKEEHRGMEDRRERNRRGPDEGDRAPEGGSEI